MLVLKLIIGATTPMRCGTDDDPLLDQPVNRDAFGYWRVPGSSIAGSLRALAAKTDPAMAEKLFGINSAEPSPSLVWCEDAVLLDFDNKPAFLKKLSGEEVEIKPDAFVRDHAALNEDASVVNKFDSELVPAGARFLLEIRCDGWKRDLAPKEEKFFEDLCAKIAAGGLSLGGGRSKGYGQYRVLDYSYEKIDLKTREGQEKWLNSLPGALPAPGAKNLPAVDANLAADEGLSGELEIDLSGSGAIIIGGGHGAADIAFALTPVLNYAEGKTEQKYILPSTSVKGVLRAAAANILASRGLGENKRRQIIEEMFGRASGESGIKSKISVSDCELNQSSSAIVPHVALDRFSGGPMTGALFDEQPVFAKNYGVRLKLKVDSLRDYEAALFFHLLLDLADGRLAFGNGVNRGNGRLEAKGWRERPEILFGDLAWNGSFLRDLEREDAELNFMEWDEALDNARS
ncbi:MAG: hypothetical protein K2H64_05825 [Desulfovibrio sp.]|nr:hypothetical protein [Desulfovibrio sp.]